MTDQRLRRLEREVAASPSLESEAALLRERLRAGALSLERLELAAYCGHEAALDVVGRTCDRIHPGCPHGDLCLCCGCHEGVPLGVDDCWRGKRMHVLVSDFVAGLSRWGAGVQTMAAIAAANAGDLVVVVRGVRDNGVLDVDAGGTAMAAAREAGEAPVRSAIQSALISWALGSQG